MTRALTLVLALTALTPTAASAQTEREPGRQCASENRQKWVLHHLFAARVGPAGGLNNFRLGLCFPLVWGGGLIFDYTHFEVGVESSTTPVFSINGPYVQLSPLSILKLRVSFGGLGHWALPLDRAGYHTVSGYGAPYAEDDLPAEQGGSATGWVFRFATVLQARVPVGDFGIVLLSQLNIELWDVGDASFYPNLRVDLITARQEWQLRNDAIAAFEIPIPEIAGGIRVGVYDVVGHIMASGAVNNELGLIVNLFLTEAADWARDLAIILRGGTYTTHLFRVLDPTATLGLIATYSLGPG